MSSVIYITVNKEFYSNRYIMIHINTPDEILKIVVYKNKFYLGTNST